MVHPNLQKAALHSLGPRRRICTLTRVPELPLVFPVLTRCCPGPTPLQSPCPSAHPSPNRWQRVPGDPDPDERPTGSASGPGSAKCQTHSGQVKEAVSSPQSLNHTDTVEGELTGTRKPTGATRPVQRHSGGSTSWGNPHLPAQPRVGPCREVRCQGAGHMLLRPLGAAREDHAQVPLHSLVHEGHGVLEHSQTDR